MRNSLSNQVWTPRPHVCDESLNVMTGVLMPKTYDCENVNHEKITVNTDSTDRLTAVVQSETATQEQKQTARELLQYAADCIDRVKDLPPLDQAACRMLLEYNLSWVLKGTDRLVTETVNGRKCQSIQPVDTELP